MNMHNITKSNKRVFIGFSLVRSELSTGIGKALRLARLADTAQTLGQTEYLRQLVEHIGTTCAPDDLLAYDRSLTTDDARTLTDLADNLSSPMRGKAHLSLGARSLRQGNHQTALEYYRETIVIARKIDDWSTFCKGMKMVGVIHSMTEDHRQALEIFASVMPLTRKFLFADPFLCFDLCNSFVLELAATGQRERAASLAESLKRSRVPEFMKTVSDIQRTPPQDTSVSVTVPPTNVVHIDNWRQRTQEQTNKRLEIFSMLLDHPDITPEALNVVQQVLEGAVKQQIPLPFLAKLTTVLHRQLGKAG
jgi:tetratricopeptide (TPR) repeat protein